MPCEILVVNVPKSPGIRGEPFVVKDQPCEWGTREQLPNWCRVVIPDATADQVRHHLNPLVGVFTYDVLVSNANGKRIRVSIHPAIITVFGADAGMRAEMRTYLEEVYGASYVPAQSDPPLQYVMDFPIPGLDVQALKADFEDKFSSVLAPHRFYFSDADMDTAVSAGG